MIAAFKLFTQLDVDWHVDMSKMKIELDFPLSPVNKLLTAAFLLFAANQNRPALLFLWNSFYFVNVKQLLCLGIQNFISLLFNYQLEMACSFNSWTDFSCAIVSFIPWLCVQSQVNQLIDQMKLPPSLLEILK